MEELIALLIQLVLEVGLQLLGSFGFDFATTARRSPSEHGTTQDANGCGWLLGFAVFGSICGGISLIFKPNLILPTLGLRLANLLLAPFFTGALSYLIAATVWAARGASPRHHFWRGFCFALFFGLVRFAYAHR